MTFLAGSPRHPSITLPVAQRLGCTSQCRTSYYSVTQFTITHADMECPRDFSTIELLLNTNTSKGCHSSHIHTTSARLLSGRSTRVPEWKVARAQIEISQSSALSCVQWPTKWHIDKTAWAHLRFRHYDINHAVSLTVVGVKQWCTSDCANDAPVNQKNLQLNTIQLSMPIDHDLESRPRMSPPSPTPPLVRASSNLAVGGFF